jgi:hypothetical protein
VPRTTPPTSPAAAVATPAITGAFEDPFELLLLELLRLLEPLLELPDVFGLLRELVACLLRELADLPLELFALLFELLAPLRELVALLFEALPRFDDALPLGFEPFELREVVFRLVDEPELAWAINPSLSRCPAISKSSTPFGGAETPWVPAFS